MLKEIFVKVKARLRQSNKGWDSIPGQVPVGSWRGKRRELFPELKNRIVAGRAPCQKQCLRRVVSLQEPRRDWARENTP